MEYAGSSSQHLIDKRLLHVDLLARRLVRSAEIRVAIYGDRLTFAVSQVLVKLHLVNGGQVNAIQSQLRHGIMFRVAHEQRAQPLTATILRHDDTLDETTVRMRADGGQLQVAEHHQVVLQQQQTGGQLIRGGTQLGQPGANATRPLRIYQHGTVLHQLESLVQFDNCKGSTFSNGVRFTSSFARLCRIVWKHLEGGTLELHTC